MARFQFLAFLSHRLVSFVARQPGKVRGHSTMRDVVAVHSVSLLDSRGRAHDPGRPSKKAKPGTCSTIHLIEILPK